MKTKILILAVLVSIIFTACRKTEFPEGGKYYSSKIEKEIVGEYKFTHYYINGLDSVNYYFNNDYVAYINFFGRDGNLPNNINFFYQYHNDSFNTKNITVGGYSWGWNNKNKSEIYVSLSNFEYWNGISYIDTIINCGPFSSNTKSNWNILKLKDNELYLETEYNGKTYRVELKK